jgi:hypothetical protein
VSPPWLLLDVISELAAEKDVRKMAKMRVQWLETWEMIL